MWFRAMIHPGRAPQNEDLDRPLSNYDVIGIPTGQWSTQFFACFSNLVPSCVVSFCCPCVIWGQIVVRAQIPLLVSIKNAFSCLRLQTGFGAFVDYFAWSLIVSAGLIIILIFITTLPRVVWFLFILILIFILGPFVMALGHTRTAFKEKYLLPTCLPDGCHFWDMLLDHIVMVICMPCALAQMARHVFQYDRMDSQIGLFLSDPAALPPLRPTDLETGAGANGGAFIRPERADTAGLIWTMNGRHPNARDNTGAAHRREAIQSRQQQQLINENIVFNGGVPVHNVHVQSRSPASTPIVAAAVVTAQPVGGGRSGGNNVSGSVGGVVYNADGSKA